MNIANDHQEASKGNTHDNIVKSIEKTSDTKTKIEFLITASALEISKEVDADIAERAKTFKLAGFSKGKGAPVSIVKRQIGKQVMTEHIDKLIHSLVLRVARENDLNSVGMPNIEIKEFNPEGELKISIGFNIMPTVPEIDFSSDKYRIEILELNVSNDDIKQAKDALTRMVTNYKEAPEGHSAAVGDAVIIDFHSS
jgi:trigger factor